MKKLRLAGLAVSLTLVSLFIILFSCNKEHDLNGKVPEGQQRVKIFLTDNPVNYDAVYVDIQKVIVQVIPDSCKGRGDMNHNDCYDDDEYRCSVWDTLDIRAGVYNLLDLSNGADTILATGFTLQGRVNKLKLVLGDHNSVIIDSVSYPLSLFGNNHSVTIQIKGTDIDDLTSDDLQLWLDFDAGGSIVRISNNHFVLNPRIKVFVPAKMGSIKGKVLPLEAKAVVAAIANGDTLVAIPNHFGGWFKIRGLKGSTADVFINATANGYKDTTITGVAIQAGKETDIGTIQLHK